MEPRHFELVAVIVGVILTVGSFFYAMRGGFNKAHVLFGCVGAILVALPIIQNLKIKTKDTEIVIDRLQRLESDVKDVASVQSDIVDVQKEAVAAAAPVAAPDQKRRLDAVVRELDNLDRRTKAINSGIATRSLTGPKRAIQPALP
jgi:hypothetical protein